jgi:hypothetical protein
MSRHSIIALPPSRNNLGALFPLVMFLLVAALALTLGACRKDATHTSDPKLEGIDELLAKQLPPGTPMSRVVTFLKMRGYELRDSSEPHTLVAIVHHINPHTIQPEAARVTFRFDNDLKLVTYDLQPAATLPIN